MKFIVSYLENLATGEEDVDHVTADSVEIVGGDLCFFKVEAEHTGILGLVRMREKLVCVYAAGVWTSFSIVEEPETDWTALSPEMEDRIKAAFKDGSIGG